MDPSALLPAPHPHPSPDAPEAEGTVTLLLPTPPLPKQPLVPRPARRRALRVPLPQLSLLGAPSTTPKHPRRAGGRLPGPPTPPVLAGSAGRGRHRSPWVVCYSSQLPPSPERFRRRVTHELECAKPPANRASCLRPRRGGGEGRAAGPAVQHGSARHSTALGMRTHDADVDTRSQRGSQGGHPLGWGVMRRSNGLVLYPAQPATTTGPQTPVCPPSQLLPACFGSGRSPGTVPHCRGAVLGGCFTPHPAARPASSGAQRTSRTGHSTMAAPGPHLGQCLAPQVSGRLPTGGTRDGHVPACHGGHGGVQGGSVPGECAKPPRPSVCTRVSGFVTAW